MEKVRPWCGQPSGRGRLKIRTELHEGKRRTAAETDGKHNSSVVQLAYLDFPENQAVEPLVRDLAALAGPLAGGYPVAFNSAGDDAGISDPRDL